MKNGSNNKLILSAVFVTSCFVLAAGLFYKPVLKNADDPFIDLSGSVGNAIGKAREAYGINNPTPTTIPIAVPSFSPTPVPTVVPVVDEDIEVVVQDEQIKMAGVSYDGFSSFKSIFRIEDISSKTIVLIDDYAESRTFKKLINYFKENGVIYEMERR